ncbi:MAG: methylenetetrahydrofolate--tRNA-(uracil(54)-C(5))-methyltransferase (FADH(2)-oxidizing) TrmFO [Clostridia bacterium]|nr:methylenetetrahydrofolate--tRNA-(uracil(54)-C(5))-methyltransferase (FADH(2)-oxidizing) TrmFO [Clostridia bacterium]
MNNKAIVIGAGLAGCEAAYQLAKRGIRVDLYEMKPRKYTPAHHHPDFAELVCSNSLRGAGLTNAVGLLKEEMRRLDSVIMRSADATQVPAGGALAVDRTAFSSTVTQMIREHPNITVVEQEITEIPQAENVIIATGPLTSQPLSDAITALFGREHLSFFDAAAPIVTFESIDMSKAFFASRYNKGSPDYINCPMNEAQYRAFHQALKNAECAELHDFDHQVFEGCMPIEEMARRGEDTMRFGPLKPVGLVDDRTGAKSYGVVQLRKDNAAGTLYNIVGFQTHLKFPEQKRVFSMIPGLENAEFVRYGVMHRNTYLNSPALLNRDFSVKGNETLFFAGQMTGVEGYVESASSGLLAGLTLAAKILKEEPIVFPDKTAIGALGQYISNGNIENFQPMNINFGIIASLEERVKKKADRYLATSQRSLAIIEELKNKSILFKGEIE